MPLLIAFGSGASEAGVLMLANGQTTGPLPSMAVSGPLGSRLIGTAGLSIVAVSSDGALTTLEKNVAGSPSVIGRDDGQAWAWAVQTNSPACGSSTRATFDIYTDEGNGATKIGSASFGAGVTQVSLVAWTAAGIVASGDNSCGGMAEPSTLAISPAMLINPAAGTATGLASRLGADCNFGDIGDDGTIVCTGVGSAPALRVIAPDGTQTNYSISTLTAQDSSLPHCVDGVLLSADADFAAIALSCPGTRGDGLVILDLASGHVAVVTGVEYLTPTLWTPDDDLIASVFGLDKTYSVTASGLVTLISATYAAQTSVG
jgi:hypothetical protein